MQAYAPMAANQPMQPFSGAQMPTKSAGSTHQAQGNWMDRFSKNEQRERKFIELHNKYKMINKSSLIRGIDPRKPSRPYLITI